MVQCRLDSMWDTSRKWPYNETQKNKSRQNKRGGKNELDEEIKRIATNGGKSLSTEEGKALKTEYQM